MITWRKEGDGLMPGWNVRFSWRDLEVNYLEVDIGSGQCRCTRVRWRWAYPDGTLNWKSSWRMSQWNLIDSWVWLHDYVIVPRTYVEDAQGVDSILPEIQALNPTLRARYA
jgi:hypothetical protein